MESQGLIHEESLLNMSIIPELVHQQFCEFKKWMLMRNYPADWTAIGFWLQIHSNEELNRVFSIFNGKGFAKKQATAQRKTEQKTEKEVEIVDDEWDKEHIDEMEGQF